MTSEFGQTACFVYIMLPGTTSFVTVGRFVLDSTTRDGPPGRFVYGRSYLARKDAVAIDPVELRWPPLIAWQRLCGFLCEVNPVSPDRPGSDRVGPDRIGSAA